ncbi:MAG: orotidine-5'-phosphate decarboxylase [Rhodobiaceae bacterium]|nr:orotidine-5'-phosphate decarboxylase [Rhodobiaceae bacterium]
MAKAPTPRERLIVGLDVASVNEARSLVDRIGDAACHYKIGHALQFCGGLDLARDLVRSGRRVFLDVKLHDIPNTVANGIARIADLGVGFVTVHAYPQTMAAAVEAARGTGLEILAVSVLTSMGDDDLKNAGYALSSADLVLHRAKQAAEAGVAGIVCAPPEVSAVRAAIGHACQLVTPGIRPAGTDAGDQKRIATPESAIAAGADYLVAARPVIRAGDPAAAADAIVAEIEAGLAHRSGGGPRAVLL